MAADWMDVARYADSDGYLDDKHRDFSPWRDWVITAFNNNIPYNDFATKQLAGDLIPNANTESILATAFNRLHKKNSEAGIIFEENRVEYVADRTATVSKAFLSLSVECARCHDHKYDPISQKDHYKMSGFFNSTNEIGTAIYGPGQTQGPSLLLTSNEQKKVLSYIKNNINTNKQKLSKIETLDKKTYDSWVANRNNIYNSIVKESKKGLVAHYPFDTFLAKTKNKKGYLSPNTIFNTKEANVNEPEIKEGIKNKGIFMNDYTNIKLPKKIGWYDHTDPFSISLAVFPNKIHENAVIFNHCEDLRLGLKGYSMFLENNHLKFIIAFSWPTNAIEVI